MTGLNETLRDNRAFIGQSPVRVSGLARRDFLGGLSAATLAALGWGGCVRFRNGDERLADWRPGFLDLHFIYTGCGENMFFRLPDGTAILNDCGEFYRPKSLPLVPLLPSAERLGGEWVSRYIQRVYPEREIDYALFSHWHSDHVGHAEFSAQETPDAAYRFRTLPDGRRVNGFLCVAEDFRIRRLMDHQYPAHGKYGTHEACMGLIEKWAETERKNGLVVEPFRVGALNQIRMVRTPERFADSFSIRNVCANGVLWDGGAGAIDLAAEHVRATGENYIDQNVLSAAFVIRYGRFSYFSTGDVQTQKFVRASGEKVDYETLIGERVGPVTVCKMGHHDCSNAMGEGLVRHVCADAYVGCMWCPAQAHPTALDRLAATPAHTGRKALILPQLITAHHRSWFEQTGMPLPHSGAVHVVVRVAPGGESYRVFLLDARDEGLRIVAEFERTC